MFTISCIANLHLDSPEVDEISTEMNCGQRCLLRGLISTASQELPSLYKSTHLKVADVSTKGKNLRTTLGKLFNRKPNEHTESVALGPNNSKRKGKGKYPMKGPVKRKVKEYRLRVIRLSKECTTTPTGPERESLMKDVWVRECGQANELSKKICDAFCWEETTTVQYMYANGRFIRPATLKDVENAEDWDVETARALMGSGCLYVTRGPSKTSSYSGTCDERSTNKETASESSTKKGSASESSTNKGSASESSNHVHSGFTDECDSEVWYAI